MKMKKPDSDQSFVFGATSMLANRLEVIGSTVTKEMTFKQWLVLLIVRDMPEGSSVADIAAQHGSTRQNVKKLLDGLAQENYVELKRHPSDKRSYAVSLTRKGKESMDRISIAGFKFVDRLFAGTAKEDVAASRRVMEQLLNNLNAMNSEEE